MKKTIYLYCSMVFLAIIATIVGFNAYNNMWIGLLSAFVVVIPSVYSLIPLIMEYRKSKNVRKNKLTESIFTDRKEDLEDIIRILNVKEHCIQITGEEEQCGKTWMAKRLCDYINNQNDPEFRDMKLKCAYVTADYLDMDNYTEMELNAYFKDNIVTNKTVLIFDHVDNFKIILSKQRQFHFQMIYILKYILRQGICKRRFRALENFAGETEHLPVRAGHLYIAPHGGAVGFQRIQPVADAKTGTGGTQSKAVRAELLLQELVAPVDKVYLAYGALTLGGKGGYDQSGARPEVACAKGRAVELFHSLHRGRAGAY